MLCQNCHENEANVRYTQIINGVKKEMILCSKCSKELGLDNINLSLPIDFSSYFGDFLNDYDNNFMPMLPKIKELKCDKCNMTYSEFIEKGKFGCDNCYEVFSNKIDPILKRLQGSNRYIGKKADLNDNLENKDKQKDKKVDKEINPEEKISKLKLELKELIKEEKYEEAAKVRDEIKKMEGEK